jgi:HK97 gp10 family phage protein|tara:strand:- start:350 stop:727 length:378 start_codon:yes stop_codon:yes gene_type:complete
MTFTVKVVGDKAIDAKFRKMRSAVKPELKDIHAAGAKLVESSAISRAPVRSGALRASIRSTGTLRDGVVRSGKAKVPYAGPIHFGWSKRNILPQPFLYDALDARKPAVLEVFDDGINKLIRKYDL